MLCSLSLSQGVYVCAMCSVGRRIMVLKPKKYHMIVYDYLASFLPATKETLQRRLKMMLKSEHVRCWLYDNGDCQESLF